jgi:phospholipid/cholesterol/gamma-HCH transport system substrate-binding protein
MINFRANLVSVGAVVIAALVSLVVAIGLITGRTGRTDAYYTIYPNVSGIKFGTQVFYEGYPIGQVEAVEPQQQEGRLVFRVNMSITRGWKIPMDSSARAMATGLLAPHVIAIDAGRAPQMLRPGSMIPPGRGGDLFASVASAAGDVHRVADQGLLPLLDNVNEQVSTVGKIVDGPLRSIVNNTDVVMRSSAEQLPQILAQVRATTSLLNASATRIDGLLDPAHVARVDRILASTEASAAHLEATSARLDAMTKQSAQDLQSAVSNLRETSAVVLRHSDSVAENLEESTRNLREFSREIRDDPALMLRGRRPPDDSTNPESGR